MHDLKFKSSVSTGLKEYKYLNFFRDYKFYFLIKNENQKNQF